MWFDDRAGRALGMTAPEVPPGMGADDDADSRGHGQWPGQLPWRTDCRPCDSVFAFAGNGYDEVTVAAWFDVTFVAAGGVGDLLMVTTVERARFGRSWIDDSPSRATTAR